MKKKKSNLKKSGDKDGYLNLEKKSDKKQCVRIFKANSSPFLSKLNRFVKLTKHFFRTSFFHKIFSSNKAVVVTINSLYLCTFAEFAVLSHIYSVKVSKSGKKYVVLDSLKKTPNAGA